MTLTSPDRSSTSLAVWYRPRRFSEVVGQRHVTSVLKRSIAAERLPSQILFSGGSGLGKTTLARVTAASLLCETPLESRQGDACGECESCLDITTPGRMHPDVVEFDAASNGGKDEIRAIAERAQLMPLRGEKKVYIIDEAHGLSGPGGQAFLKLLEEPPSHVVFMLATTDPNKMLPTNRGRCTEFELLAPTDLEMVTNLMRVAEAEGWPLSDEAALAVVQASDPALGVRATLMSLEKLSSLLDDGEVLGPQDVAEQLQATSRPLLDELIDAIERLDPSSAFDALSRVRVTSTDSTVFDVLADWARSRLLTSTPATFELARYRLAQLVERPHTPGQIELAIANLTRPMDNPDSLAALIDQARAAATELGIALSGTLQPPASPETHEGPEGLKSSATEAVDPEAFVEAVALIAPRAAALLRSCELTTEPGVLRIIAPEEVAGSLRDVGDPLRQVAADMGLRLFLRQAGRP